MWNLKQALAAKQKSLAMPLNDLVEEHEGLVAVLKRDDPKEIADEAEEQAGELKGYKQKLTAAKKQKDEPPTAEDYEAIRQRFGENRGCSFKRDKDGIYCHTHRARSDSYPSVEKIPQSAYDFICSTG